MTEMAAVREGTRRRSAVQHNSGMQRTALCAAYALFPISSIPGIVEYGTQIPTLFCI